MRITLKTVQPNSISQTYITIRFNLLHFYPSAPSFVFAVLYFTEFDGHFPCMNLAKFRDAVPLNTFLFNICWTTVHDRT